ncbi:type II toxin-antitoxin system RelE/ParE family toxin [Candidatus Woesearchaeota archaeon]|nr:type II toxin-antitoxin system RelE/ParE family toxin [Candidatus Woesearchaeota archaeon]
MPKAIKSIQKLPENIRRRIFDKIRSTKPSPFRFFERLEGRTDFKLRIGPYRAFAEIDVENRIIYITVADHRGRIYKNI